MDDDHADSLEEALFRPVQLAYGRAKRTYSGFASRAGLEDKPFAPAAPPSPAATASALVEEAVDALLHAEDIMSELQDSMLPVEVGDPEFRTQLAEVREILAPLEGAAHEFMRTFGR
jgi:hypothetical protein